MSWRGGCDCFFFNEDYQRWVECRFTFKTDSPKATCAGRMMLLPVYPNGEKGEVDWKIWVLSTWLVDLDNFLPDEGRLTAPSNVPSLARQDKFETDVLLVGAGNR